MEFCLFIFINCFIMFVADLITGLDNDNNSGLLFHRRTLPHLPLTPKEINHDCLDT